MSRKALITGITGQDGSYLADLLMAKGYEVHGLVRRVSTLHRTRIDHLPKSSSGPAPRLELHYGDLADPLTLVQMIYEIQPDEIYNLGAQSHVRVSFDIPVYTGDVTGLGSIRVLEAIRRSGIKSRFYQASSSEMYGKVVEIPQTENTPFYPRSPYAAAKAYAYWVTVNYRESFGIHATNGILFNHESPRRGENFVTRKITHAVAAIKLGLQETISLGNLQARRDWGYAPEYVEAMWQMLQMDNGDDYVLATNETHTVQEFVELAFGHVGLDWKDHVRFDPTYERPAEVDLLIGNPEKAKRVLGWEPTIRFAELVKLMVDADLAALQGLPVLDPLTPAYFPKMPLC
jgi:GDPmannose 4,6-dehydratase